jgi:hypothetical protein
MKDQPIMEKRETNEQKSSEEETGFLPKSDSISLKIGYFRAL